MKRSGSGPTSIARPGNVRLREVAERAGVSTATVSRVLNNVGTVSDELRVKIEAAIGELAYVPHWAGKALASQRSRTIGAVVPTLDIAIFAAGVEALQDRLHEHGYTLLLASYQYRLEREKELALSLIGRGVDGLVLVGHDHDPAVLDMASKSQLPLINTYTYEEDCDYPCIGFDNRGAAARVAGLIRDLGHADIGIVTSHLEGNDRIRARLRGMREAFQVGGIDVSDTAILEVEYSIDDGRRALRELMRRRPNMTAVCCTTDAHAIGAILEAARLGISVPQRLSITGFDDLALASQLSPALTTVHVPARELGRRTADYIAAAMRGNAGPRSIALHADLVLRGSHGPPPAHRSKQRLSHLTTAS